jgi:hypothetical protein
LFISTYRKQNTVREDEAVTARNELNRVFTDCSVLLCFNIRLKVPDRVVYFALRFRIISKGLNLQTMRSK